MLGTQASSGWPNGAAGLRPEEAWNIDTKTDDGNPGTGIVGGYDNVGSCYMADSDPTTTYNPSNSSSVGSMFFNMSR